MDSVRERLRSLLIVLLEALAESGAPPERGRLRERAAAAGFGPHEVDGLLAWLQDREAAEEAAPRARAGAGPRPTGIRCLAEDEAEALTPAAFGYLLELSHRHQISRPQMERLIQVAALVAEAPLERREMADLLEQVLLRPRGCLPPAGDAGGAGPH